MYLPGIMAYIRDAELLPEDVLRSTEEDRLIVTFLMNWRCFHA
jgi:hypothetical protein